MTWADGPDSWIAHGEHEADLYEAVLPMLTGGVAVDCGAHVGGWTVRLAERGLHVIAVEPDPESFGLLMRNCEQRGLDERVEGWLCAVWSTPGYGRLNRGDPGPAQNRITWEPSGNDTRLRTVDQLTAHLDAGEVSFVKVDTEGSEVHVLRGARRTLERHRPVVLVECHRFLDPTLPGAVVAQFGDGWDITLPSSNRDVTYLLAVPRAA